MTDVHTKDRRSYNMSMIRGKDTTPEIRFRKYIFSKGLRGYRIHYKLIGKPDIVFVGKKVAVFIDGCFWHKCPKCFKGPKTNKKFWTVKFEANVKRAGIVNRKLRRQGWSVVRIWEHEVKHNLGRACQKLAKYLTGK